MNIRIPFNYAWKDFVQAFNKAYRTNLELDVFNSSELGGMV
jgi:hypothetical protein